MTTPKRRAAIYCRVSRDDRRTGRSVEEQEHECREQVSHQPGWRLASISGSDGVPGIWKDNARSASKYARGARSDWENLLSSIRAGLIDVLVVWEPSRATRDRQVWAALAAVCEEHDVLIAASGQVYDLNDPDQAFQLDLFFSLGVRESGVTRKRILRTVRAQAAKGRPHGKIPYGYKREYDPDTGSLICQVVREDHAEILNEVAERVLSGEALLSISTDLNKRNVPAPRGKLWSATALKALITNPRLVGDRVHQGVVVGSADWPAIFNRETYLAVVSRLTDANRGRRRDASIKHLLSGFAVCDVCGGSMFVLHPKGGPAYSCGGKERGRSSGPGSLGHVSRSTKRVEADVESVVTARLAREDLVDLLASRESRDEGQMQRLRDELASARAQLEEARNAAAARKLSVMSLAALETALMPEIESLEERLRVVRLPPVVGELAVPDVDVVRERWEALPLLTKRLVIQTLLKEIRVKPVGRGRRNYTIAESLEFVWS
ncbi:recombinase family protein [Nocardiopsis alba]|uniref:Recombinase family protein n=1 Tax=Nocardiopsis alba TaxID=53437 RepID=A0A7K2IL57_9ACTN|nr:recombinase family protein [Nocardiopsis alba]MYR30709.1 recombinase family protein [Nocardiopsis alba]MYR30781.1 recombinase family protein [Nocardiopsis alba]